ncbi:hypothetical protein I7I51_08928 [Histoplasma capsulatum]|uniref:Uncharacterized protein n=1 Tax=Ajellomyces capsulatus TaxID=5037 RepID=A0A8A1M416_AJECA|nr:hypothetical protein I7I51_08928 [Histoplasma capsulatum]
MGYNDTTSLEGAVILPTCTGALSVVWGLDGNIVIRLQRGAGSVDPRAVVSVGAMIRSDLGQRPVGGHGQQPLIGTPNIWALISGQLATNLAVNASAQPISSGGLMISPHIQYGYYDCLRLTYRRGLVLVDTVRGQERLDWTCWLSALKIRGNSTHCWSLAGLLPTRKLSVKRQGRQLEDFIHLETNFIPSLMNVGVITATVQMLTAPQHLVWPYGAFPLPPQLREFALSFDILEGRI